jgi:SAM-dependent methyltransferase
VSHDRLREQARVYYEARVQAHGATPAGVDWNSRESQELRFRQLERLWEGDPDASLLDYGCGYGALAGWARARGHRGAYRGFDVSAGMVEAARATMESLDGCRVVSAPRDLEPCDYAVASGVLNVKQDVDDQAWQAYVLDTVADLARLGTRGFAFNALTSYSDPEKMRGDLYYADPMALFDHCKRTYSRLVSVLHDYPLYEFTIIVRR